ncbi:conserved Plasmodium protein, unknown function [Plasmodium gaboni]|uniref:Gamma-tubulin complex component n=1 Tax=Plasmodium gaboni TaxID=647221 RepID=A0ABY1UUQ9_9APIC|nr:conserved Plasmodium protein, unknown function [Plasmodium gaboni]
MIHEVILSLIGQTGDIIVLVHKNKKTTINENINIDDYRFEVNNNIHIFLNSEIKIINEIVELGYYFYIINIFLLLVNKNTVYKNVTHIHKYNKLNQERKNNKNLKNCNIYDKLNNGYYSSSNDSFSSISSSSDDEDESDDDSDNDNDNEEGNDESLSVDMETKEHNKNNSYDNNKNKIDTYFGVILKKVKSINNVSPCGYYANGICNEIKKFIKKYLKKISDVEEYINNNSNTPLTQIVSMLEKKREELLVIINIIKNYLNFQKREEENVIEGECRNKTKEILDYLYEHSLNGNSRIKKIYHKYLKNVGKIFLHQLFSWILYGQLVDPYNEFFIQKRQFIYSDEKKIYLTPEELYENLTLSNVQSLNFEWNYLFFQSLNNLPQCCMDKIAGRKILFIGKSIRILIRSNKWNTSDVLKLFPIIKILSKPFDVSSKYTLLNSSYYYKDNPNNMSNDPSFVNYVNEYENANYSNSSSDNSSSYGDLSDSTNDNINLYCKEIFDITIEKIRSIIAYKLWKYIVKDINLIKIFDLFKDIYLLNNGDFYDYFLEKSWSLMHIPPNMKNEILLKSIAWKNSSLLVEEYCKSKYENKKDKLIIDNYDNSLFTDICSNSHDSKEDQSNFFFHNNRNSSYYTFDTDTSENFISKYFYPRISYKSFSYDSFEGEKFDNLILGGMCYIYDNKIVLNDFYKGIQTLFKKKYYDYDNIFSVCINNYRQQILRGFKHGFDFSVNFNNFFDNQLYDQDITKSGVNQQNCVQDNNISKKNYDGKNNEDNFLVGSCFALVIHSVKNPLLYKTDILNSSQGYWGNLGDCLSVEIRVKFYEKKKTINNPNINNNLQNNISDVILGDVEIEVSLYIGGKGISSFVHNSNSYSIDYNKESFLNNKLIEQSLNQERERTYYEDDHQNDVNHLKKNERLYPMDISQETNNTSENVKYSNDYYKDDNNNNYNINNSSNDREQYPVLKIQSNKQTFYNINKNTITKFRVRINCLKHTFSVYIQKLDEYNLNFNNTKNKIKPIIHIRALDMTQAFSLDIGNAYIGLYTCPILFNHKLLKKKSKLNEWFKNFYNDNISDDMSISNDKNNNININIHNEKTNGTIENELRNRDNLTLNSNHNDTPHNNIIYNKEINSEDDMFPYKKRNIKNSKNLLLFSCYDCSVEIYKWFHQSYKSSMEIPEIDIDNETLIFYDKQINKNIKIHSGLNLWNNIEIHFKLTWPIALIINTSTIYTYNSIFQFLFLLSRIHYNLKILCYHNRNLYKYLYYRKGSSLFSHLFSIRYKMQFFFSHVIRYLQEDIINYEYKLMSTQIHKSKDFEYTKSVHDLYISQIATKCFLRIQDLTYPLMELIDVSFKFCYFFQCLVENELFTDILNNEISNDKENDEHMKNEKKNDNLNMDMYVIDEDDKNEDLKQVIEKLLQYNDIFNNKLIVVINEMIGISSNSNHAYIIHLLTILDFNSYITKIKDSRKKYNELNGNKNTKDDEINNANKNMVEDDNVRKETHIDKTLHIQRDNFNINNSNDEKMEYEDIENIHIIDNYQVDKKDTYNHNISNVENNSTNILSQKNINGINAINGINGINEKNTPLKSRIVNNFNNLLYNNIDVTSNIQPNGLSPYNKHMMMPQSNESYLNGNINIASETMLNNNKYSNYNYSYNNIMNSHNNIINSHNNIINSHNNIMDSYNNAGNNNYNSLIDKYSNILNSYMNNTNSIYNSPKNFINNSNIHSYNSILNASKLRNINNISSESNNIGNDYNNNNINKSSNNILNYNDNNNISSDIGSIPKQMDLNNIKKSIYDPNFLNNNNTTTDNIGINNLNNLMDINVKNQFNVQNIIDQYNYNTPLKNNISLNNNYNINKISTLSPLHKGENTSNYSNIPLHIYQSENNTPKKSDHA